RVLDIGCRDGLFCYEAEKLGAAEVIGFDNDPSPGATEFLIPFFNSKVAIHELNIYDLKPETFGRFDIVLFPGLLYHLRYPFWALKLVRDVLKEDGHLILETAIMVDSNDHAMLHCPIGSDSPYEPTSCTFFNMKGLTDTLQSLGLCVRNCDFLVNMHLEVNKQKVARGGNVSSAQTSTKPVLIDRTTIIAEMRPEIIDAPVSR